MTSRTKVCNVVRGMLRQEGIRLPPRSLSSFVGWRCILANGFEETLTLHRLGLFKALGRSRKIKIRTGFNKNGLQGGRNIFGTFGPTKDFLFDFIDLTKEAFSL